MSNKKNKKAFKAGLWMPHPVNYTPYFKWLIHQRESNLVKHAKRRMEKYNKYRYVKEFHLDLYLVIFSKESKSWKSRYQLITEIGFEAVYGDE